MGNTCISLLTDTTINSRGWCNRSWGIRLPEVDLFLITKSPFQICHLLFKSLSFHASKSTSKAFKYNPVSLLGNFLWLLSTYTVRTVACMGCCICLFYHKIVLTYIPTYDTITISFTVNSISSQDIISLLSIIATSQIRHKIISYLLFLLGALFTNYWRSIPWTGFNLFLTISIPKEGQISHFN